MSKIGQINLDLQEQANELGFSTVEEAIDNGYVIIYEEGDEVRFIKKEDWDLEQAHLAWEVERDTIITKLQMVADADNNRVIRDVILEAIEFIRRGEV